MNKRSDLPRLLAWKEANPDQLKAAQKRYYRNYWSSPEERREYARTHYRNQTEEQRERARERNRAWRLANPDKVREQKRRGHYRKHLADRCQRCGFLPEHLAQLEIHHKDGNHSNDVPSNLETLCANCHRLHHARKPA